MTSRGGNGFRLLVDVGAARLRMFGVRDRRELEQLRRGGFVAFEKRAGTNIVAVINRPGFEAWIAHRFPAGIEAAAAGDGAGVEDRRIRGVRVRRDSKAYTGTGMQALLIRLASGVPGAWHAVATFVDDLAPPVRAPWPEDEPVVALAENRTFFHRADLGTLGADAMVAYEGRMSDRVLRWCEAQAGARLLLCPDYDYVGLDEYRRVKAALGERVSLFVPGDFEGLIQRYGKRPLVESQGRLAASVGAFVAGSPTDSALARVFQTIVATSMGLEQEALLISG